MDGIELMRRLGDARVGAGVILASGEDSRMLHISGALSRSHGLYLLGTLEKPLKIERLVELLRKYDHNRTLNMRPPVQSITGHSR
jgi:response regulator of citrate/malate metabolism